MKITNNKGFTLIELIMVIVILGILAAVIVPKFFDFTTNAHDANEDAVIGTIKAALEMYAADQIVKGNGRKYPDGDDIDSATEITILLDEFPDGWTVGDGTDDDKATFTYTKPSTNRVWTYTCTGVAGVDYTLTSP